MSSNRGCRNPGMRPAANATGDRHAAPNVGMVAQEGAV